MKEDSCLREGTYLECGLIKERDELCGEENHHLLPQEL